MANLKLLRNRIQSVKTTQKITKAMRMVAASKLNKAKSNAEFSDKFRQKIISIINSAKNSIDETKISNLSKSLLYKSKQDKALIILFCSDRGLCGPYNSHILKLLFKNISEYKENKVVIVGSKLEPLVAKKLEIIESYNGSMDIQEIVKGVKTRILKTINRDPNTDILTYYTHFKNSLSYEPKVKSLLPIEEEETKLTDEQLNVEFEGEQLIDKLTELYIDSYLTANFYESKASEEASRMNAMDNATRNAGDLIDDLTLKLNRSRQAIITNQLIEVISGAEAI